MGKHLKQDYLKLIFLYFLLIPLYVLGWGSCNASNFILEVPGLKLDLTYSMVFCSFVRPLPVHYVCSLSHLICHYVTSTDEMS